MEWDILVRYVFQNPIPTKSARLLRMARINGGSMTKPKLIVAVGIDKDGRYFFEFALLFWAFGVGGA
jgi:hypothetical protein